MSIDKLVSKYAPPKENNVKKYRAFLHKRTGVHDDRKIKDFTKSQFERLVRAIQIFEGYKEGKIIEVHQINKAKRNHKEIYAFNTDSLGWISKKYCISLTNSGKINLVTCQMHNGSIYLRARPNDPFQKQLSALTIYE